MLQRAIYVSDAVGTAGQSLLSIAQILGVSDVNNRRDRVSGVLMFHRGQFLQLLEGTGVDLDRLLKRLAGDTRHENMRMLSHKPIEHRCFGDAPMVVVGVEGALADLLGDRRLEALAVGDLLGVYQQAAVRLDMAA